LKIDIGFRIQKNPRHFLIAFTRGKEKGAHGSGGRGHGARSPPCNTVLPGSSAGGRIVVTA